MTPGNPLAKPHLLEHYLKASYQNENDESDVEVEGVIYVETDVRYDDPRSGADVATWAKGPLDEISFLRSIVNGAYGERESKMLLGVVPWAPMDQPPSVLREYLRLAEERAGEKCWKRVKGFRFLLQFFTDQESFEKLVLGDDFIGNLKELGNRNFSFDVGVDQRSGGSWQLELVAKAMEKAHEGVDEDKKIVSIVNHLCKPAFDEPGAAFERWCSAITAMSRLSKTYMKLSGAFSELPERLSNVQEIAGALGPWLMHLFENFGAKRIMFGSDWPVCNVQGPRGEDSWTVWKDIAMSWSADSRYALSLDDVDWLWYETARGAYTTE